MGRKQTANRKSGTQDILDSSSSHSSPSPPKQKRAKPSSSSQPHPTETALETYKLLLVRPLPLDAHPTEIVNIVANHKWQRFMRPEVPCFPRVVREFYANLTVNIEDGFLSSTVLGHNIVITPSLLNNFYGFSTEVGAIILDKKIHEHEWPHIKAILKYDPTRDSIEQSKHLNPNHIHKLSSCSSIAKLLGRILQENLIQIGFHKSDWTNLHLKAVYHILNKDTLNTSHIIFTTIATALQPRTKVLPYGNSICELLSQHFKIDLSSEEEGPRAYRFTPQALFLHDDQDLTHLPSANFSSTSRPSSNLSQISSRLDNIETTMSTLVQAVNALSSTVKKISSAVNKLLKAACIKPTAPTSTRGKHKADSDEDDLPLAHLPKRGSTKRA